MTRFEKVAGFLQSLESLIGVGAGTIKDRRLALEVAQSRGLGTLTLDRLREIDLGRKSG